MIVHDFSNLPVPRALYPSQIPPTERGFFSL
jgi:hypothetical protein